MKFFILLLFVSVKLFSDDSYCIGFIHIGNNPPEHLFISVEQARYMNKSCDIYLLLDDVACKHLQNTNPDFISSQHISLINLSFLPLTEQHKMFRQTHQLNSTWRDGFWHHTTERFFYLYDFIQNTKVENLFHFESDVMLYVDLNELLPMFDACEIKLASTFQWVTACVPGIVYIKNAEAFQPLVSHIASEILSYKGNNANNDVNDMCTLASFRNQNGDRAMTALPILMPKYADLYPPISISLPHGDTTLEFLSQNYNKFPGYIFDAAALGIFVNGYDRRNFSDSKPGVIHYKSLFDPGRFSFYWGEDSQFRKVPYFIFENDIYRVVNLHLHSKLLDGYTSFRNYQTTFPVFSYPLNSS